MTLVEKTEADLVKEALSHTTYGTQGVVAMQIATNAIRVARKYDAARIRELEGALSRIRDRHWEKDAIDPRWSADFARAALDGKG